MNTFAYTACFLSGGLETTDNYLKGRGREKVKNHWSGVYIASTVLQHVINL